MSRDDAKPKLYLIEGTDGSGKTTFTKWIEETYGFFYHHYGPPEEKHWVDEYLIPDLLRSRAWGDQVLDRGWIAEPLWAGLLGREPLFSIDDYEMAANLYTSIFDFRVLVLQETADRIIDRIVARGENGAAIQQAVKAIEFYNIMPGAHVDSDVVHSDPKAAFEFLDSDAYWKRVQEESR
jgi:hypothetical protein